MSNIQQEKIIDNLLERYQDLGGDIEELYENHNLAQIETNKVIEILLEEIDNIE